MAVSHDLKTATETTVPDAGAGTAGPAERWLSRFGWLLPVAIAVAVYWVGLRNFFSFDDFIWLNRARTFGDDVWQIFRPDVTYFDPIVHLMFVVDSRIGGLDPRWYHGVDLAIHAVNSVLVYRLARQLGGDSRAAIYCGSLFAGSFAIADAVLWSSSRVDLVATLFSLATVSEFLKFLRSGRARNLAFSYLFFLLALGAKGTPLLLPVVLLWLVIAETKDFRRARCLIPFAAIVIVYFVLLKLNMHKASLPLDQYHFSVHNLAMSISAMFIPERILKFLGIAGTGTLTFVLLSVLALPKAGSGETAAVRRTGYLLALVALVPVLVVTEFKVMGDYSDPVLLLLSPSHRIYLAWSGGALLCGAVLRGLELKVGRLLPKSAMALGIVAVLSFSVASAFLVRERSGVWGITGDRFRAGFEGLQSYRQKVVEGGQLGLIKFPGSSGFLTPMTKLSLGLKDVKYLRKVQIGFIRDMEVLNNAETSFLFVLGVDGRVYDKTPQFRQQLLLNRMALATNDEAYAVRCQEVAEKLLNDIDALI